MKNALNIFLQKIILISLRKKTYTLFIKYIRLESCHYMNIWVNQI